jgi:hypothetical protein
MQIEQLASMPKELGPPTTTTIYDAVAASPKVWSVQSFVVANWRSKGALILYAFVGLTLVGCKMFLGGGGPNAADASQAAPVATAKTNETRTVAKSQPSWKAKPNKPAETTPMAGAVATTSSAKKPTAASAPTTTPVASAKPRRATTTTADPLGALYIDEVNGFSIRFPAAWQMRTFDGDPWVIDVGDGRVGLISVGFGPFPDNFTVDNIPPDWVAKKIKRKGDTTLHAQGYAMVGGRKALWSKSTGPLPMSHASPRMTRVNYILPLGDGRVLELRVAAAPEQFDKLVPVMRKAVETFALHTPRKRDREPVASAR